MEIRLLGPIEASFDGRPVALGPPQQRAVLAMLALQVNRTVSTDRLIEGLWDERAPPSGHKLVQLYVSHLRKLLDGCEAQIVTRGRGYELQLAADRVDAARFERLVTAAVDADSFNGEARKALALWRGAALADVADEPFAGPEIRRLEELRLRAAELAIDADLAAGRHGELIGELEALVAEDPLREQLHAQRMLALYRSGRQAEALEAYREVREILVEQIGVEPGPELRRLHEAILRQDAELEPPTAELTVCRPSSMRERRWRAARPTWSGCESSGGMRTAAPAGSCWSPVRAGLARHAWSPSSRASCTQRAREWSTSAGRRPAVMWPRPSAAHAAQPDRRCSSSTICIGRPPRSWVVPRTWQSALGNAALLVVLAYRDDPPPAAVSRLARELEGHGAERLALRPLAANGVREIAELYAGQRAASAPVDQLLEASGGVPRRIHGLVADWATGDTVERVGARAGRTATRRGELRAVESELVSDVVDLQTVREKAELYLPTPAAGGSGRRR